MEVNFHEIKFHEINFHEICLIPLSAKMNPQGVFVEVIWHSVMFKENGFAFS